jgi:hypothetical protein
MTCNALGVVIVISIAVIPPSTSARAASSNCSDESARMIATRPASSRWAVISDLVTVGCVGGPAQQQAVVEPELWLLSSAA